MPTKDYYVVLGVSRSGSPQQIRDAFRELARRYHPDRAGPQSKRQFQRINEAYRVLSDEDRRAAYDRGLGHGDGSVRTDGPIPVARGAPEPLVPDGAYTLRDVRVGGPPNEWLFDRFADAIRFGRSARRMQPIPLDVELPRSEALRGGVLTIPVPVFYPCLPCRGSGWRARRPCRMCNGGGLREESELIDVTIPPMVTDGTLLEMPLRGLGVNDMYLLLRIRVT